MAEPQENQELPELLRTALGRGGTALHRQIFQALRALILDGVLRGGDRLPPGRSLAKQLGVSRNTVNTALDQLTAEGFIEGRQGSGTFVVELWPRKDDGTTAQPRAGKSGHRASQNNHRNQPKRQREPAELSRRGTYLANLRVTRSKIFAQSVPFGPGVPDLASFPFQEFARLNARVLREMEAESARFGYGAAQGLPELREAIAAHVRIDRGVRCAPEQIVVVNGSQQGLDLCARMLLDPGDVAFVEEPGYLGARAALQAVGAQIVGVPVGPRGIDVAALQRLFVRQAPRRAMLYTTPSHQFPLGMTLGLNERLRLLSFARESGLLILEDDYDSEYRYDRGSVRGRPISALQGLDEDGQSVVYLGTFSKVLAPGLRLGYLVLPPQFVPAFVSTRGILDRQPAAMTQAAVARFLTGGGYHRHVRRMRARYQERRAALLAELDGLPAVRTLPGETGLHITAVLREDWLAVHETRLRRAYIRELRDGRRAKSPQPIPAARELEQLPFDALLSEVAARHGLDVPPLSNYYLNRHRPDQQGVLFGFAAYEPRVMRVAIQKLAGLLLS